MGCGAETKYGKEMVPGGTRSSLSVRCVGAFFFEIGGCLFDWKDRRRISLRPHTFISSSGMSYVHCLILVRAERAATNVFLLGPDG